MRRRGELDQIITTPIVLILCVVIMGIFFFLSNTLFLVSSPSSDTAYLFQSGNIESQSLRDTFLHDEVEGILVEDYLISHIDSLKRSQLPIDEYSTIFSPLEILLNRSYSCNGQNAFFFAIRNTNYLNVYLDFPQRQWIKDRQGLPLSLTTLDLPSALQQSILSNPSLSEKEIRKEFDSRLADPTSLPFTSEDFGKGYAVSVIEPGVYVGVKAGARC